MDRRNERYGTRVIPHEYIDLCLASPARGKRACHARAAVWRVARRVRGAPLCAHDCPR
jgi:hypothetical protein